MKTFSDMFMAIVLLFLSGLGLQILRTGGNDLPILLISVSLTTWLSFRLFA